MNACVCANQSKDELIFRRRMFCRSGEDHSRIITSDEYNDHIFDCEDIILLRGFKGTLDVLHAWRREL